MARTHLNMLSMTSWLKDRNVMKVAIVTLTKMYNYGNSLQNYAVQEVLRANGLKPETIMYEYRTFKQLIKDNVKKIIGYNNSDTKRKKAFDEFEKKYITKSVFSNLKMHNDKAESRYRYYFVGSDQVWNASWYNRFPFMKDVYLLTFTDDSKKVSYAASFGIDKIPDEWAGWFGVNLSRFKAISVREDAGKKIVECISSKKAQVLIDPTMMLDAVTWRQIEKNPGITDDEYILCYFLSKKCGEAENYCSELEKEHKIINVMDPNITGAVGPSEFLWMIDHASLVLTDSFHGSVFSMLFEKPFLVFDRQSDDQKMNSRLVTLLAKFGLERKYSGLEPTNSIWEHEYSGLFKILAEEREIAIKFIKESIS